jgi:enamine deaminase RidA (YjgF/YER057c/UK114 family)
MTQVEFIQPTTLPSNNNAYTHVVRVGDWVFVAGQTAGTMDGHVIGPDDPAAQTRQVYARLARAMEAVGGSLSDIVETKTFWTDVDSWPAISAARAGVYGDKPPTGTRIAITSLARPEFLLEVEATGYLGKENESGGVMPAVEHSQPEGMSPNANRYSHVVKIGPWVHIAGQTASDVDGNVVGVGDPAAQVEQVFANLTKAVESVGGKLSDIIKTTVYVVGKENSDAIRAARTGRFGDKPPTSTLLIIDGLARPEFMLEIEALAYVE